MDWLSAIIVFITGALTTIFAYEYQHWREHATGKRERKTQVVTLLQSELNKVIINWTTFKKTEDMQIDPGLSKFKHELGAQASSLRDIISRAEVISVIPKELLNRIAEVSDKLTSLSQKKLYINGERSWNEFLESGDKIVEECEKLKQELTRCI